MPLKRANLKVLIESNKKNQIYIWELHWQKNSKLTEMKGNRYLMACNNEGSYSWSMKILWVWIKTIKGHLFNFILVYDLDSN